MDSRKYFLVRILINISNLQILVITISANSRKYLMQIVVNIVNVKVRKYFFSADSRKDYLVWILVNIFSANSHNYSFM